MRSAVASSCFAALALATGAVHGQDAAPAGAVEIFRPAPWVQITVTIEYARSKAAWMCRDAESVRGHVAARLGYDPFDPRTRGVPSGHVRVWVDRVPGGFSAKYEYVDADGKLVSSESAEVPGQNVRECEWAMVGVAVPLAAWFQMRQIALGKELDARRVPSQVVPPVPAPSQAVPPAPPVTDAPPAPEPAPAPLPPVVTPPAAPPQRKLAIRAGIDAVSNPLVAPSVSLGVSPWAGVRFRDPAISIELGLRAMWSVKATVAEDGVRYRWAYTSGVLAATLHKSFLFGGPVFEAGTLRPRRDGSRISGTLVPAFFALGLRAGVERTVADLVTFRASIEGEYVAVGANLRKGTDRNRLLWAMPTFSGAVVAGIAFGLW